MGIFVLSRRRRVAEEMDDPRLAVKAHFKALAGLERINRISCVARAIWPRIERIANEQAGALRVLDVATGAGDLPRALLRLAKTRGVAIECAGCDISPAALRYARMRSAAAGNPIELFRLDALREPIPSGYDVIVCALLLHHLDGEGAVKLLRSMRNSAGRAVLADDLSRDPIGLAMAWAGTRVLSLSPVVHADGTRSVRAAFTMEEAAELARAAGLEGASITPHWPRRWLMEWRRR